MSTVPDSTATQTPQEHVSALFVQFSPELRGFILALMPEASRADDVFQEVFLTASRKAADFRPGSNFLAWACTIARYKVLEAGRRRSKEPLPLSDEVIESLCAALPPPDDRAEDDLRLQALNECIESLHPHTRRAMEMRYDQGHKPAQIAARLGWTAESVYAVLSRARATLRECVAGKMGSEPEEPQ